MADKHEWEKQADFVVCATGGCLTPELLDYAVNGLAYSKGVTAVDRLVSHPAQFEAYQGPKGENKSENKGSALRWVQHPHIPLDIALLEYEGGFALIKTLNTDGMV